MVKYSRQREAIKKQISDRIDHPTAETIYAELKEEFPNISLATVYRNLNQLVEWGEIQSIKSKNTTRFDPNVMPHAHFFCRNCGNIIDIQIDASQIREIAQEGFDGKIESCVSNYYGICPDCMKKN